MKNRRVALVAGATRGAGRGIARGLGEKGFVVYCSGRSTRGHAATPGRTETIDETAEIVTAAGGEGIAVQTDHRDVVQVRALVDRMRGEHGRLDVLVNDIWGQDAWIDWWFRETKFWTIPIERGLDVINTAVLTHIITAREAMPLMLATKGGGLIAEITDGDGCYYRGQFYYDFAKTSVIRIAMALAHELRRESIASVAITPGFPSASPIPMAGCSVAAHRRRPSSRSSAPPRSSPGSAGTRRSDSVRPTRPGTGGPGPEPTWPTC